MTAKARLSRLVLSIRQDIEECGALEEELATQQRLLGAHDTEGLEKVGKVILERVARLDASSRVRAQDLTALGLPEGPAGMGVLASRLPAQHGEKLLADWHRLEAALARCQVINERNGELLASNRMVMDQLTGQAVSSYGDGYR